MFPMESFMERQWEPGPWKGVFVSFPPRVNKKISNFISVSY